MKKYLIGIAAAGLLAATAAFAQSVALPYLGLGNLGADSFSYDLAPAFTDRPPWAVDGSIYGHTHGAFEGRLSQPSTQVTMFVGGQIPATNSATPYEKAAGYFRVTSADPSSPTVSRDAVGVIGHALIVSGVTPGSATGAHFVAQAIGTGDGRLGGIETDLINGVDQPNMNQPNQKYGNLVVAGGGHLSTVAFLFQSGDGGASRFQRGFVADPQALAPNGEAFSVLGRTAIMADGSIQMSGGTLYAQGGALYWRSPAGRITRLGAP